MGAASSVLNSSANELLSQELRKPVDGSDVASSPTAALEEVKRLRKELRRCLGKEEFKKRKENNKWRRGSFGQIKAASDFWDKQNPEVAPVESEVTVNNLEEELKKMANDMSVVLADTPKNAGASLDERLGQPAKSTHNRTKRRSFVLEKGLSLVDSDSETES